jgi:hypothetical protein
MALLTEHPETLDPQQLFEIDPSIPEGNVSKYSWRRKFKSRREDLTFGEPKRVKLATLVFDENSLAHIAPDDKAEENRIHLKQFHHIFLSCHPLTPLVEKDIETAYDLYHEIKPSNYRYEMAYFDMDDFPSEERATELPCVAFKLTSLSPSLPSYLITTRDKSLSEEAITSGEIRRSGLVYPPSMEIKGVLII